MNALTHEEVTALLHEAASHLTAEQRAALAAHLAECDSCRIYADQLNRLQPLLRQALHTRHHSQSKESLQAGRTLLQRRRRSIMLKQVFALAGAVIVVGLVIMVASSIKLPGQVVPATQQNAGPLPNQSMTTQPRVGSILDNGPSTILLLGLETGENAQGKTSRADAVMLVTVNPTNRTAALLSIPRDLYVTLPDRNEQSRLGAVYFLGSQLPDGGARYTEQAITENLGIPIQRYIVLDFEGFKKVVDAIGGIDVDVPQDIFDEAYPTTDYGTEKLLIPAGPTHMDGELALKYVRTRHQDSDFARQQRQQQVLEALRDKALRLDALNQIPEIFKALGDSLQTDLTLSEMLSLAGTWKEISSQNSHSYRIDQTMVQPFVTAEQQMVLQPDREKVAAVVAQFLGRSPIVQSTGTLIPTLTLSLDTNNSTSFKLPWTTGVIHCVTQNYPANGGDDLGLDFDLKSEEVLATQDGTIIGAGWNSEGGGNTIVISHTGGFTSAYAHLREIYAGIGQQVIRGQIIGLSGDTGNASGPLLHFQIMINGRPVESSFAETGQPLKGGDCVISQNTSTKQNRSDRFEPNDNFEQATLIALNVKYDQLNFATFNPSAGSWDDDYFKVRVKPGMTVTCRTLDLAGGADTNLILYDNNQNGIAGQDDVDRSKGDLSSSVTYVPTYEGWLYLLVGEGFSRSPEEAQQATYSLECSTRK